MPGRTLAIGDVHGCSTALDALLALVAPTSSDVLVFLGDLVDKGPDSRGVIERLLALQHAVARLVLVLGNHDEHLLAAVDRWNQGIT